jgi:hypothetical protein
MVRQDSRSSFWASAGGVASCSGSSNRGSTSSSCAHSRCSAALLGRAGCGGNITRVRFPPPPSSASPAARAFERCAFRSLCASRPERFACRIGAVMSRARHVGRGRVRDCET